MKYIAALLLGTTLIAASLYAATYLADGSQAAWTAACWGFVFSGWWDRIMNWVFPWLRRYR